MSHGRAASIGYVSRVALLRIVVGDRHRSARTLSPTCTRGSSLRDVRDGDLGEVNPYSAAGGRVEENGAETALGYVCSNARARVARSLVCGGERPAELAYLDGPARHNIVREPRWSDA